MVFIKVGDDGASRSGKAGSSKNASVEESD
jgi:hypothetical protein